MENLLPIKITRREVLIDGKNIGMVHKLSYSDGPGNTPGNLVLDVYSLDREIEIELESAATINKIDPPADLVELLGVTVFRINSALGRNDLDLASRLSGWLIKELQSYGWIILAQISQIAEGLDKATAETLGEVGK